LVKVTFSASLLLVFTFCVILFSFFCWPCYQVLVFCVTLFSGHPTQSFQLFTPSLSLYVGTDCCLFSVCGLPGFFVCFVATPFPLTHLCVELILIFYVFGLAEACCHGLPLCCCSSLLHLPVFFLHTDPCPPFFAKIYEVFSFSHPPFFLFLPYFFLIFFFVVSIDKNCVATIF